MASSSPVRSGPYDGTSIYYMKKKRKKKRISLAVTKYRDEVQYLQVEPWLDGFVTGGGAAGTKAFIVTLVYTICLNYLAAAAVVGSRAQNPPKK